MQLNVIERQKKFMALNIDELTYDQAKTYYLNYLNGRDSSGIGQTIANDSNCRWNQYVTDWKSSDNTYYQEGDALNEMGEKNNRHSNWALTGGIAGAGTSVAGGFMGEGGGLIGNNLASKLGGKAAGTVTGGATGVEATGVTGGTAEGATGAADGAGEATKKGCGPGTPWHAALMLVSAGIQLLTATRGVKTAKETRKEQDKNIKAYQNDLAYDFQNKLAEADAEKEEAAFQYEEAMIIVEENKGRISLSDAVAGALKSSNTGLSQVASGRSSAIQDETGEEITTIADKMVAADGKIDSISIKFESLQTESLDLNEMGTQYGEMANKNKWGMYLTAGGAALTILQCIAGIAASGPQWWNYIMYGLAIAGAGIAAVKSFSEAKEQGTAQECAIAFADGATVMGENAGNALGEAGAYASEYDDYTNATIELSNQYGGTGGQTTTGSNLA